LNAPASPLTVLVLAPQVANNPLLLKLRIVFNSSVPSGLAMIKESLSTANTLNLPLLLALKVDQPIKI
jgi:hypothetical protein